MHIAIKFLVFFAQVGCLSAVLLGLFYAASALHTLGDVFR